MQKTKINISLDKDLIEFAKLYAEEQRTTVSEIIGQFILNLRRVKRNDPTEMILSDPDFKGKPSEYCLQNPLRQDEMAQL